MRLMLNDKEMIKFLNLAKRQGNIDFAQGGGHESDIE